ncbi:uncharacterized protein METZ01_LOCUS251655, partial [marine metagenome]
MPVGSNTITLISMTPKTNGSIPGKPPIEDGRVSFAIDMPVSSTPINTAPKNTPWTVPRP